MKVNRDQKLNENSPKISRATKMPYGPVYVMGAAMGNTSDNTMWDIIKVYASLNRTMYEGANISCCLRYPNGEIVQETPIHSETEFHELLTVFTAQHFTCKNDRHSDGIIPTGASIVTGVIDREVILRRHSRQFWSDQQMTIFNSLERMSEYTYFGIIDHDEFLVPSENRTIKEMLVIYGNNKQTMFMLLPIGWLLTQ